MTASPATPLPDSVDPDDLARFERLGAQWWDPQGPMKPLHRMNPARVGWLRDQLCRHFDRDPKAPRPLGGLTVLDVGCGGGILCEPMARMGAEVTGIDPAPGNVEIARAHAERSGLSIAYRAESAEALAAAGERFDAVLCMEVVEHVVDPGAFVATVAGLTRPGGAFFASTLNRTLKSFALAIVGAEYVLRWLPRGTHDWNKFLTPQELADMIRAGGLEVATMAGCVYDPLADVWRVSRRDVDVNYMIAASRPL
ncbi:MAG: bifunctional 2-polyprenyl-6-hydroxyphenol methylase/3-demethylubiquinol 3-O-methyltransferase UbiG [Methylobacteriaceae bacterium]|nr:bifunctional 2-polyprenyl-6-hydroxyphenol methylase/3-demethylubiquinol 3-O-methyltransferase UbiG [Methylobacteriaceae bacterium]